jgi:hypothetical protein
MPQQRSVMQTDLSFPIFELVIQHRLTPVLPVAKCRSNIMILDDPEDRLYLFMIISGQSTYHRFPAWIRVKEGHTRVIDDIPNTPGQELGCRN